MQLNPNEIYKECLHHLNVEKLNEMQLAFIDKATSSANLMLLAPTGSGKTIAFLLPVINRLAPDATGVQALIIAPSRELALQIENVFRSMKTSFKITCCYGGHSFQVEQNSLSEAPSVIIGTPGRLADHIHRKSFDANSIRVVVLDEFDKYNF
jgi:superfamily II DNA/RNA helicase